MFRVVTAFTAKPALMMMCDHPSCSVAFLEPLNLDNALMAGTREETIQRVAVEKEQGFVKQAKQEGWLVSLGLQLCPGHHQTTSAPTRIVVPTLARAN